MKFIAASAGFLLVLLALYLLPLHSLEPWGFSLTLIVLGWLASIYLNQYALLRRRALLEHTLITSSRVRQWLWSSAFTRIQVIVRAVALVLVALLLSARLQQTEWLILFLSVVSFALLYGLTQRILRNHAKREYRQGAAIRMAFYLNTVGVALVLSVVQLFFLEVPDTRHLTLFAVVESAYQVGEAQTHLAALAPLMGLSSALNDGMWHLLQVASGGVEAPMTASLGVWLLFLFINALKLAAIWSILLGLLVWISIQPGQHADTIKLGREFVLVILLVCSGLLIFQRDREPQPIASVQPDEAVPCAEKERELASRSSAELRETEANLDQEFYDWLEREVNAAFSQAESGIDAFLDWNFSLTGQYLQLGYLAGQVIQASNLEQLISSKVEQYIGSQIEPALDILDHRARRQFDEQVTAAVVRHRQVLNAMTTDSGCFDRPLFTLPLEDFTGTSLVGVGLAVGTGAAVRAGIVATATRRATARSIARLASRGAATGSGAGAGALCGPAAPLCIAGLGTATWISMDLTLTKVDEFMHREEMRNDLTASLEAEQERVLNLLFNNYSAELAERFSQLEDYQQRQFNIYRDGL